MLFCKKIHLSPLSPFSSSQFSLLFLLLSLSLSPLVVNHFSPFSPQVTSLSPHRGDRPLSLRLNFQFFQGSASTVQSDSSSEFGFFFSLPVISRLGYRMWQSLDGFFSRLWIACDIGWWKVVGFGGVSWVFCFFFFPPQRERERGGRQ